MTLLLVTFEPKYGNNQSNRIPLISMRIQVLCDFCFESGKIAFSKNIQRLINWPIWTTKVPKVALFNGLQIFENGLSKTFRLKWTAVGSQNFVH